MQARRLEVRYSYIRIWINWNDPDFLIVRVEETADDVAHNPYHVPQEYDPWKLRSGSIFQRANESRCWATIVLLSGGMLTLSDRLSRLNEKGWEQIRTVFQYFTGRAAIPLDILENMPPRIWYRPGDVPLLAVFNWGDQRDMLDVDLGDTLFKELHIRENLKDIWSGRIYHVEDGILHVELLPRDVILLLL